MREDTSLAPSRDPVRLLDQVSRRIAGLLDGLTPEELGSTVPSTPHLSVRGVLAHLARAASEAASGSPPDSLGRCSDHKARDQAEAHEKRAVPELLEEWLAAVRDMEAALRRDEGLTTCLLVDAVTHEHDLRAALDAPGFRDDPSLLVALDALSGELSDRVEAQRLPALRITVEQWGTIVGHGAATRCLVADRFEFVRGMAGRRSAAQVRRWNWSDDASPYLQVMSSTGALSAVDVRERDPRVPEHMRDLDLDH